MIVSNPSAARLIEQTRAEILRLRFSSRPRFKPSRKLKPGRKLVPSDLERSLGFQPNDPRFGTGVYILCIDGVHQNHISNYLNENLAQLHRRDLFTYPHVTQGKVSRTAHAEWVLHRNHFKVWSTNYHVADETLRKFAPNCVTFLILCDPIDRLIDEYLGYKEVNDQVLVNTPCVSLDEYAEIFGRDNMFIRVLADLSPNQSVSSNDFDVALEAGRKFDFVGYLEGGEPVFDALDTIITKLKNDGDDAEKPTSKLVFPESSKKFRETAVSIGYRRRKKLRNLNKYDYRFLKRIF